MTLQEAAYLAASLPTRLASFLFHAKTTASSI